MHLLSYNSTGLFSLTDYPQGSNIPPYAILSHTWGAEEVTYNDLKQGIGQHKIGYEKIRFCDQQARLDGLQYFWVDTCCIDKSSSAELAKSINVSSLTTVQDSDRHNNQHPVLLQLRRSRWFTRGWTLQELIAPETVDFYSREGIALGSKESLMPLICDITGIPARALRGDPLSHFTTSERMAWAERRRTTEPEDKAYSLLGIFETHMSLIYGEGEKRALKRLREKITKDQKEFSVPLSLYGVPEIAHFVSREQELAEMHSRLKGDGRRQVVVIYGLGGMGKTQLAIEYMKRYMDNYSAIFWLNFKDENSIKQSFARIARQIERYYPLASGINALDEQKDLDKMIEAVKAWLSLPSNSRWLLVYDNYDNPKLPPNKNPTAVDIQEYFPESYQGSIIITTRSSQVKIGHGIRMSKIQNLDDSLEILSTTSKRKGLVNEPDAVNLAKQLDGFPLALATAGAYLEQTSTTFGSYLRLYKDSWAQLQITSPKLGSYEDRTLYSTWQLSFDQIQRESEHSAALLRLWAYFDNQDLWLELLQSYHAHGIEWIYEITKDELAFSHTVRKLSDFGLIEVNSSMDEIIESRGYSVHSCVHSWMTNVLNQEWNVDLARFAVLCIASHIRSEESNKWWLTQRRILQHAEKYSGKLLDTIMERDTSWVCNSFGNLYSNQGKLNEAEEMYQRALQGFEKAFGPNHTSTLNTVNNLGTLYTIQGKLKEAKEMYQRALQGQEKAFGPDHTLTLGTVNNLGNLYTDQGKLKEAEEMYQRALQAGRRPSDVTTYRPPAR
ncbi:hypothetical protein RRF57_013417 [Xylaria bambusicola]|uniref:Heterokaryon incompatibility domain-containing protein n=1 Tax=Xylaria bambusicola TaxID=326684 RepID=A0AAN7ZBF4_9PEZI